MSNKTEELDSGGPSLPFKLPTMEQIQDLIGNHSSGVSVSDTASDKQYGPWRQPRAINHKYCDSCGESGDLMCCDKCPASFHLECLDPPMAEEDAPSTGEFICKRCTALDSNKLFGARSVKQQDDEATSTCSNASAGSGPSTSHAPGKKRRGKKTTPADIIMPLRPEQEELFIPTSNSCFQNAFQMLMFAAKYTNPKEFELDKGFCINDKIPDTYKSDNERKSKGIIELENGIVPLPMKFCHICKRTCQKAPLLQCDFCPLLFHLDCLDPPLATFPPRTDRWMCPVHAEHIIDNHILTSSRLSERIRLWDEFARRSDHDTQPHQIKMRFLRRATLQRHRRQMLGKSQYPKPKVKVQVPSGVKMLYKHPPMLLPRVGDFVDSHPPAEVKEMKERSNLNEEEKDTWLKAILKFNVDALDHMQGDNKNLSNSVSFPKMNNCVEENPPEKAINGNVKDSLQNNGEREDDVSVMDAESTISRVLDQDEDVDVRKLDSHLIALLAQHQVNYLLKKRRQAEEKEEEERTIRLQDGREVTLVKTPCTERPCAVLSPMSGNDSIPLCGRRMTIGTSLDEDLCLQEYGDCKFVSPKHAVIFYDKYSRIFELLNYSGHGTSVDSVLYTCDLASKSESPRNKGNRLTRAMASLLDVPLESLRRNRRREKLNNIQESSTETVHSNFHEETFQNEVKEEKMECEPSSTKCACTSPPSSVLGPEGQGGGLEGAAVLHHGSVVKFGCLQFVFAVVHPDLVSLPT